MGVGPSWGFTSRRATLHVDFELPIT
jgi:hypothetical protein